MPTFSWKQGDLAPPLNDTLIDGNGNAVDLTGATAVQLVAKDILTGAVAINAAASFVNPRTAGTVSYQPVTADTLNPRTLRADWKVTFPAGVETFPVRRGNDELLIVIAPKIV